MFYPFNFLSNQPRLPPLKLAERCKIRFTTFSAGRASLSELLGASCKKF